MVVLPVYLTVAVVHRRAQSTAVPDAMLLWFEWTFSVQYTRPTLRIVPRANGQPSKTNLNGYVLSLFHNADLPLDDVGGVF